MNPDLFSTPLMLCPHFEDYSSTLFLESKRSTTLCPAHSPKSWNSQQQFLIWLSLSIATTVTLQNRCPHRAQRAFLAFVSLAGRGQVPGHTSCSSWHCVSKSLEATSSCFAEEPFPNSAKTENGATGHISPCLVHLLRVTCSLHGVHKRTDTLCGKGLCEQGKKWPHLHCYSIKGTA